MKNHPYAKTIWDRLNTEIKNEYGTAALMGNLYAESGLYPDRVQGDIPYSSYSQTYTANVDNGTISKMDFAHNAPNGGGYGLAQWTYYTRKIALYDFWKNGNYPSIGSVELACDFLIFELKNSFVGVWEALANATSIRAASDVVLHDFENPADQSESVEELRCELGTEVYNAFAGSQPDAPTGGTITKNGILSKLLLFAVATDDI